MSIDNDLDALGAITAAETGTPSEETSQEVVTQALKNTDMENIETVLVDFSELQAEQDRAEGLSMAAESLKSEGRINLLTAQSLTTISKTIMGTADEKIPYTQVATKVGLQKAIESLLSEEEAARSQAKHACAELITRAGKCAQGQMTALQAASRKALVDLTMAMADFNDEFYSVSLNDVCLNNGEMVMDEILRDEIVLSSPLYGDQSMFNGCKPLLTKLLLSKGLTSVPRWIGNGKHYVVVDNSIVDIATCVTERAFENKSNFYPEDQAHCTLGAIWQAAGSQEQNAYETQMVAGITEGIYQLQQFLSGTDEQLTEPPEVILSKVIYITKVISCMVRSFEASVLCTEAMVQVYRGLTTNQVQNVSETDSVMFSKPENSVE